MFRLYRTSNEGVEPRDTLGVT